MNEMRTTFSEEKEYQVSNIVTEGEKLPCIYKNYIYQGKNWKCPIYSAENHCEHYHCILCQGIYPKDRAYKMRLGQ